MPSKKENVSIRDTDIINGAGFDAIQAQGTPRKAVMNAVPEITTPSTPLRPTQMKKASTDEEQNEVERPG